MYKVTSGLFFCSSLVLAFLYFNKPEVELKPEPSPETISTAQVEVDLKRELIRLKAKNVELEEKVARYAKLLELQGQAEASNEKTPQLLSDSQQILGDALLEQMEQKLYDRHADLFRKLNLSRDQMNQFMALQAKRGVKNKDFSQALKEAKSEEEKLAILRKMDEQDDLHEQAMASMLGNQYAVYADHREKRGEYAMINEINKKSKKSSLDDSSRDQLATVMNSVANEYTFSHPEVGENMRLAKALEGQEKKLFAKELIQRDKLVLKEAVEYLSPEQLFVLKQEQEARRQKLLGAKKDKKKKRNL